MARAVTSDSDAFSGDYRSGNGAVVAADSDIEFERFDNDRAPITLAAKTHTLQQTERIARALEQIRSDMTDSADAEENEQQALVSAAEGTMLAASLGWLAFLLRGGSLAALAFSSLPLWRRVDPLAILALSDEERERLEEDLKKAREAEDENERAVGDILDGS